MTGQSEKYRILSEEYKKQLDDDEIVFQMLQVYRGLYEIATKTIYFRPDTAKLLGLPEVCENFPDCILNTGFVIGDQKRFAEFYETICRGEKTGRNNSEIRLANGIVRLLNRQFITKFDENGTALYALILYSDITKQREQRLATEKWSYINKSLKTSNIHYYDYNMTQDVLESIEGNSPPIYPEENERSFSGVAQFVADNIIHPDDRSEYRHIFSRKNLLKRFKRGETEIVTEHRRLGSDGKYFHAQGTIQLYSDPFNNDVLAFVVIKNMDRTFQDLKIKLQTEARDALTNSFPGGILYVYDSPKYPFFLVNEGLLDYLGYESEAEFREATSGFAANFIHPDDRNRVYHYIQETFQTDDEYQLEHRVLTRDDNIKWVVHRGRKGLDDEGRPIFISIMTDVTQIVLLQKKLQETAKAAEEATKMKSVFLANMSHEIRTPMNGIIGFTELALDNENLPDETRRYLRRIKSGATGLLEIINDILDISKIEAGKMLFESVVFNLYDIVRQCDENGHVYLAGKNISFRISVDPRIPKYLKGDPTRLRQILLNLISNAVKFTREGEIELNLKLENIRNDDATVYFEVSDTGIGMTGEQIKRIFEPFMQADASMTRKYGGTGLGLPITKSMLELMNGKLDVESVPDRGSRFFFRLTFGIVQDEAQQLPFEEISSHRLEKPTFRGTVLVCEDNSINRDVIGDHLAKVGLNVVIAENGLQAVETVKKRLEQGLPPFDLILMDIHMPVMDGLEATQKILELSVKTPIVALTANAMKTDLNYYLKQGMSDYLIKPFRTRELWTCLLKYFTDPFNNPVFMPSENETDEKGLTIIDRKLGLEHSANDWKLYRQVQSKFLLNGKNLFSELEHLFRENAVVQAHRLVHGLKSNADLLGATILSRTAFQLEQLLEQKIKSGNDSDPTIFMERLKSNLFDVLDDLKKNSSLLNSQNILSNSDTIPPTRKEIETVLNDLLPLLKSGNTESVAYLKKNMAFLASIEEDAVVLFEQIENYDFDLAVETIEGIQKKLDD